MDCKGYLVHMYQDGDYVTVLPFYSRASMMLFLRECRATFCDADLADMGERIEKVQAPGGLSFEVEEMLPVDERFGIRHEGDSYIPMAVYCTKYSVQRHRVRYAVTNGKRKAITVGEDRIYVEDTPWQ